MRIQTKVAPQPLPPAPYRFDNAEPDEWGRVAQGGDFEPSTIIAAYRAGCFPWPHPEVEYLWCSPDPRAIIPVDGLHISRKLARKMRRDALAVTVDAAFDEVIQGCARGRPEGSWITPSLMAAYRRLHALGWAHSIEAWTADGRLAGGVYGIRIGRMFGAESMFHSVTDGSKIALVGFMQWCADEGIELVDIQVLTAHTQSLGAIEISRAEYLGRLHRAIA